MTIEGMNKELRSLELEEKELLKLTESQRARRENLGKKMYAIMAERKALTSEINAIQQPRLAELKKRKSALAKAKMAAKLAKL